MSSNSAQSNATSNVLKTPDGTPVRCLYVTNVPIKAENKDLYNLFVRFGNIKTIYIKKNDLTKRNTYAFVTYETPDQASRAYLNRSNFRLFQRKLYLSVADSWHQPVTKPDGTIDYNVSKSVLLQERIEYNTRWLRTILPKKEESSDEEDICEEIEEVDESLKQDSAISRLNDDCLLHIIQFIPFSERHNISHVCRRWRNLMSLYWAKLTDLDFEARPFKEVGGYSHKSLSLYLKLCPNLKSVRLVNNSPIEPFHLFVRNSLQSTNKKNSPNSQSIINTATLCGPRLEELTLAGIEIVQRPLAAVAHLCKNLKVLNIRNCRFVEVDHEMNPVIRKCMQLESLNVANCSLKPGYWLKTLKPTIKRLSFLCCDMNHNFFTQGLVNLKHSLVEFELVGDEFEHPLDFRLLQDFTRLESIVYVHNSSLQAQKTFPEMFRNLKKLHVECNNFIDDGIIKGIVEHNPNLISLNLARCKKSSLTAESYLVIANLPHLEYLNLSMNNINDDLLELLADKVPNLNTLLLNSCENITDKGCKKIFKSLMKLKKLEIDNCKKITNKSVEAALEVASTFPANQKLSIHCAGSGITELVDNPNGKLELIFVERSPYEWFFESSIHSMLNCELMFDDDDDDDDMDDDDEDDYDFDIYDDDEFYGYPYDSDDFDYEFEDFNDINQLNFFLNFL